MKRLILSIVGSLALLMLVPAVSLAIPVPPTTTLRGTISEGTQSVSGATVVITCNGHSPSVFSINGASYSSQFSSSLCPIGATATVQATKGSASGIVTVPVTGVNQTINVNIIAVAVPEFGLMAGVVAAIASAGVLLVVRRRQLIHN
jgi:hypothetical protein